MKKTKLLSLFALLLLTALLLVSCGGTGAGRTELSDLLDEGATADAEIYGNFTAVTGLDGVLLRAHRGDLYYFVADASTGTKHIVYNAATDKILTTKTNYYNEEFSVVLLSGEDGRTGEASLSAYILASLYLVSGETSHATLTLFSADGTEVARRRYEKDEVAAGMSAPYEAALDLVLFDGVLYRAEGQGLVRVREVSPFDGMPELASLDCRVDKYYYRRDGGEVRVYDTALSPISTYRVPAYASLEALEILGNGNLLVQYRYEVDPMAEDYDLFDPADGKKYCLVTEIVTAKNGKTKEIRCDYLLGDILTPTATMLTRAGIAEGKISQVAAATRITERRADEDVLLLINGKGGLSELADFRGEPMTLGISLVADDRFRIETEEAAYLVDADGGVLGDVSGLSFFGEYLSHDGKLYDCDLALRYDGKSAGMEAYRALGRDAVLLRKENTNGDYEYYLYGGGATPRRIDGDYSTAFFGTEAGFYILRDTGGSTTTYRYCRADGTVALSVSEPLTHLAEARDYLLYTAKRTDGSLTVYRVAVAR